MFKKLLLTSMLLCTMLSADKITVFAASDLKFALDGIKNLFLVQNPKDQIEIIYGSSGKGMRQIENGAPYHLFFSANMDFVEQLYAKGDVATKPKLYAVGRIVIWSKHKNFQPELGFENLQASWAQKIAIANPTHAPYGEKAKQAMQKAGIYDDIKSKLVMGENISQTAGFIANGAADAGIIALSLACAPAIANSDHNAYYLIDDRLHDPLTQGYGITKAGSSLPLARKFYDFMETKEAIESMKKYGFSASSNN
ncbi:MAG TPA: molybdate ABC transporter substrate-binding protein [Sulfurovum sp. UBA12169]|nr:MAG TPA: molybdate ABC transporter substrate-binding protein [Sulfurovum sp. UBA12169]